VFWECIFASCTLFTSLGTVADEPSSVDSNNVSSSNARCINSTNKLTLLGAMSVTEPSSFAEILLDFFLLQHFFFFSFTEIIINNVQWVHRIRICTFDQLNMVTHWMKDILITRESQSYVTNVILFTVESPTFHTWRTFFSRMKVIFLNRESHSFDLWMSFISPKNVNHFIKYKICFSFYQI